MQIKRIPITLTLLSALTAFAQAQTGTFTTVSAGNWTSIVAPDSIAAGFGSSLTNQTYQSLGLPLQTTLGGVSVKVADSGTTSQASQLFASSTGQVNFEVPANAALGAGTATVTASGGAVSTGKILISNVAPAIFAANGNAQGPAAAEVFTYTTASGQSAITYTFAGGSSSYGNSPISLAPSQQVYLMLFGTGIRRHSANPVQATIGGVKVPVTYAGPVSGSVGLDQVNIGPLPSSLSGTGKGDVPVVVTVDGVPANAVTVNIL